MTRRSKKSSCTTSVYNAWDNFCYWYDPENGFDYDMFPEGQFPTKRRFRRAYWEMYRRLKRRLPDYEDDYGENTLDREEICHYLLHTIGLSPEEEKKFVVPPFNPFG